MRNRLGAKSAVQADTSNALRPHTRSQPVQPSRPHAIVMPSSSVLIPLSSCCPRHDGAQSQSSCCAKSQYPWHMGWVIDSDPATALRSAQDDGGGGCCRAG